MATWFQILLSVFDAWRSPDVALGCYVVREQVKFGYGYLLDVAVLANLLFLLLEQALVLLKRLED